MNSRNSSLVTWSRLLPTDTICEIIIIIIMKLKTKEIKYILYKCITKSLAKSVRHNWRVYIMLSATYNVKVDFKNILIVIISSHLTLTNVFCMKSSSALQAGL